MCECMAHKVYYRCSTEGQDFLQQQKCVTDYLNRIGVTIDEVITEKVSGTVSHKDRKLADLLKHGKQGDVIYVSELSRLGRCMNDLFAIVSNATEKGVVLVQCKDGSKIEAESIGGKALLFALSLAAEIEVANIRQRTQMALDARKEMIEKNGGFLTKSGRWCTKFGNPTGDVSAMAKASAKISQDAKLNWILSAPLPKYCRARWEQGWSYNEIMEDVAKMFEVSPDIYCTRNGSKLNKGTLSRWVKVWSSII